MRPSAKKIQGLCRELSEQTKRGRWNWVEPEEMAGHLNRMLVGWANYFCLGWVSNAYRAVTAHARHRLRQWLVGTQQVQGSVWSRYNDRYLHEELGLIDLTSCRHRFSRAQA